jgi:hypothetical protein
MAWSAIHRLEGDSLCFRIVGISLCYVGRGKKECLQNSPVVGICEHGRLC